MTDERKKPKQIGVFGKIETRDDALKIIEEASFAFLVSPELRWRLVSMSRVARSSTPLLYQPSPFYSLPLGVILLKWNSRIAAVLLPADFRTCHRPLLLPNDSVVESIVFTWKIDAINLKDSVFYLTVYRPVELFYGIGTKNHQRRKAY